MSTLKFSRQRLSYQIKSSGLLKMIRFNYSPLERLEPIPAVPDVTNMYCYILSVYQAAYLLWLYYPLWAKLARAAWPAIGSNSIDSIQCGPFARVGRSSWFVFSRIIRASMREVSQWRMLGFL